MAAPAARQPTALEFFCGIGGLHYALHDSGATHQVVKAYDVDDAAVSTYRHNRRDTPLSTQNISSLKAKDLSGADLWLLSPPCQPYTRQGNELHSRDNRAAAMQHIIDLLELDVEEALRPAAILLENVVGFESSGTRARLYSVLIAAKYSVREVWCSPAMIGVPNQRTRYFLLARRGTTDLPPVLPPSLARVVLLDSASLDAACERGEPLPPPSGEVDASVQALCRPLSEYLDPAGSEQLEAAAVPDHMLERYGASTDLVARASHRSCCFTKNYTRYMKGTGSLVCEGVTGLGEDDPTGDAEATNNTTLGLRARLNLPREDKSLDTLQPLRPRFFVPMEIARIHGFPESFAFPPAVGRKKQYELLGNSLSIQVVAALLRYLLHEQDGAGAPGASAPDGPDDASRQSAAEPAEGAQK